jgi:hypothetical protein
MVKRERKDPTGHGLEGLGQGPIGIDVPYSEVSSFYRDDELFLILTEDNLTRGVGRSSGLSDYELNAA